MAPVVPYRARGIRGRSFGVADRSAQGLALPGLWQGYASQTRLTCLTKLFSRT